MASICLVFFFFFPQVWTECSNNLLEKQECFFQRSTDLTKVFNQYSSVRGHWGLAWMKNNQARVTTELKQNTVGYLHFR